MKKGGGSESTIIIGPSKSVLVYALHSLEYVLGLTRFRVFVPNIYIYICLIVYLSVMLCFFLGHLDEEKLKYRAKSDSTFVVSVEK